ncbi:MULTISPECIES: glycosyltransferase family 2 protein [unclassified Methylobacterium]|jgi:GT2 family glycosyltransferase|uniref:glycosyltransferase family 2 protein n=1 Tax=unclassified Methylobacterium TaxID=2615210 RepID=UPI001355BF4E|nr:glycosyltransferase family 2 protein [Methylobacterium sp. 2A]MWV22041.1 glycosyltransferase family 2 protein [Methylobacterium sp. 2A]
MTRLFVGIPSAGRKGILSDTLAHLSRQVRRPDKVILCTPDDEDDQTPDFDRALDLIHIRAPKGSCSQRNAMLDLLKDEAGILLIIDDDFFVHRQYLDAIETIMQARPDIALANGHIIKDGIIGPGIPVAEANRMLDETPADPTRPATVRDKIVGYGCNMAIRLEHARDVRFDENLPLYGWLEDVDFSHQLSRSGKIVDVSAISGVHLGIKMGRTPGKKFGYSQIVNPIYLIRKGSMKPRHALFLMARNMAMNVTRSVSPEPYLDRRGRLYGNLLGLCDILRGRINPRAVALLDQPRPG